MMRDEKTKALINNDQASLNRYKYERAQAKRISDLEAKVEELNKIVLDLLSRNAKSEK